MIELQVFHKVSPYIYKILNIDNKGEKHDWAVMNIRCEKQNNVTIQLIKESIDKLFDRFQETECCQISDLEGFKGDIYWKWCNIVNKEGYSLSIVESHQYQDVLELKGQKIFSNKKFYGNQYSQIKQLQSLLAHR